MDVIGKIPPTNHYFAASWTACLIIPLNAPHPLLRVGLIIDSGYHAVKLKMLIL